MHTYIVCAYLLPGGNLLRDGCEAEYAVDFQTGGAAGLVEVVTWDNAPVWSFSHAPYFNALAHHDLEPLPNGNVLVMAWARKTKEEALQAGRRPALLPDDEVGTELIEFKVLGAIRLLKFCIAFNRYGTM